MSAAASDIKINIPDDPKKEPLIADGDISAPSGPNPVVAAISALLGFLLKLPFWILLFSLDFVGTIITFGWVNAIIYQIGKGKTRSVPVNDEVSHRWNVKAAKNGLAETPFEGIHTIYALAKRSFETYPDVRCMGTREFLGQHSVKQKHFGDTKWQTYAEVGVIANKFGAALRGAGMVPAPTTTTLKQLETPCSLAIFENTCAEWQIAAQGAFTQSMIVTTIYATLGIDAVIDAVQECKIRAMLCNKTSIKILMSRIKEMPTLNFDDFVKSGDTAKFPPTPPKSETCAVIMYTSGSTGKPKGVVVTHANLLATSAGAIEALGVRMGKEVYLGYLPLAHILELMAEFGMLGFGCTICYADPKTLTATGAYPIGALEQYAPTIMAGVPKIWDVIKKGVQAKFAAASPVARFLVDTAFAAKTFAISVGLDTPFFNLLVFGKLKKAVGGNLRIALSGGGPLNTEVQLFVRTAFGCPLFQGYGLTETCAGLSVQDPADLRTGIAGVPLVSCEVKLESCPDITDKNKLPYLIEDRVDTVGNKVWGRGEVLVRGNNITKDYYMMEEKTKEEWEEDGFFHTGDIGQFMSDGSIRIVDRKKNLVKLKGGEYIAIENMEMCYGNSSFVDAIGGGICCYGDADMDRPVALMQLNQPVTMAWAKKNGIGGDFNTIKDSVALYKAVLADLIKEGQSGGLSNLEKLKGVCFLTEPWTPENGCLTAANKLQRREVISVHEREFLAVKERGIFN
ncbi:hypothetical protein TL16_g09542 [Triparma laevis f. inornata]|uniref:AMP-dependent synthetase/ligase domain-containing protein n=1 Tax=Triparma laevis f. inornata TaxID=1714386 RepID=A0A9W7EL98_9STRA|nr:hypothetical protein TL16_g09542 [Triparma laevis f. inornata]